MKRASSRTPLVSVCIPTYNRAHMLAGCIEAVLGQTLDDFELVVSDNASEDATESVVRSFDDKRIRYVKNSENVGIRENWNRVLALAEGRFVTVFPDDDVMMPDNLEKKAAVLGGDGAIGLVHSKYHLIDAEGQPIRQNTLWGRARERNEDEMEVSETLLCAQWNSINASTVLFRRECYERLGGFAEKLSSSIDWEYWMRIAVYYKVFFLATPLVMWRVHSGSYTAQSIGPDEVLKLEEDLLAKKLVADLHVPSLQDGQRIRKLIWGEMADRFDTVMGQLFDRDQKKLEVVYFALGIFYKYPELLLSPCALKALVKRLALRKRS